MKLSIISDQISSDLETACKVIKEYNYEYVELHNVFGKSIEECSDEEVLKIKKILDKYELKVSNLASTIFFLCPLYENYQVSLFNDEFHAINGDVNTHLKYLKRACHIADMLDCKNIRVFPFRYPDFPKIGVAGSDQDIERIISLLKLALPIAKEFNKVLVLENCPYSHCPKGEMTYQIVTKINDSHLKLLWDPANSYRAEKHQVPNQYLTLDLFDEIKLIKNEIGHIHLKNYECFNELDKPFVHRALCDGDIDFENLIKEIPNEVILSLESEVEYEDTIKSIIDLKKITS